MNRSISIVDYKVNQADFFLGCLSRVEFDFFAAQCYCDSFVSAARSITYSIQSVCNHFDGFNAWYADRQARLKANKLARFFHDYRTISNHIGETLLHGGVSINGQHCFYFTPVSDLSEVPSIDALEACKTYFKDVLVVVYELYHDFRFVIDDRWIYTEENFSRLGKGIEDLEEALGYPRGWTRITGSESEMKDRWRVLSSHASGPDIQDVLLRYLGKCILGPDDDIISPISKESGKILPGESELS